MLANPLLLFMRGLRPDHITPVVTILIAHVVPVKPTLQEQTPRLLQNYKNIKKEKPQVPDNLAILLTPCPEHSWPLAPLGHGVVVTGTHCCSRHILPVPHRVPSATNHGLIS